MKRHRLLSSVALCAGLALGVAASAALAQTTLRVFSGGANQRPDLMRKLFDEYQAANPGIKIDIETGGATSELQRQYLSTVLNAKDSAIDIYMIDIVNPAQYFGAGWLEPLDAYIGKPAAVMQVVTDTPDHVAWRVTEGPDSWIGTQINFTLRPHADGGTTLLFTHAGWHEASPWAIGSVG